MHLYYNSHANDDIEKLAELMTHEKQMREEEKSPSRSDSPAERRSLQRQVNFVFRTINGVSAAVGLTFCVVGMVLFYTHRIPGRYFGSVGYVLVSIALGLDGISLSIAAVLGLLFSIQSKPQMAVYAVGGAILFCVMLVASIIRLPDAPGLLTNVSMEMSQSLLAGKRGDATELAKWDDLQTSHRCCGMSHHFDWCDARNLSQLQEDAYQKCRVPKSCFSNYTYGMPAAVHKAYDPNTPVFELGCYGPKMQTLLVEMSLLKSFVYVMLIFLAFDVLFAVFIIVGFVRES